jgi:DNA-binding CsgD family transcriptional regulator
MSNQDSDKISPPAFGVDTSIRGVALEALSTDPTVSVTLLRDDGKVVWGNDRAAKLWVSETATSKDYIGRDIKDLQPKEWIPMRQEMIAKLRSSDRPVVLRLMWKGLQFFSLCRLVKGSMLEHDRFLIVTRHVPSTEKNYNPISKDYELIEAEAVGLGHLDVLTPREIEVLALVGQGMSTKEISKCLSRSEKTIENHRYAISKKLECSSPVRVAEIARQAGLTTKDAERSRV